MCVVSSLESAKAGRRGLGVACSLEASGEAGRHLGRGREDRWSERVLLLDVSSFCRDRGGEGGGGEWTVQETHDIVLPEVDVGQSVVIA